MGFKQDEFFNAHVLFSFDIKYIIPPTLEIWSKCVLVSQNDKFCVKTKFIKLVNQSVWHDWYHTLCATRPTSSVNHSLEGRNINSLEGNCSTGDGFDHLQVWHKVRPEIRIMYGCASQQACHLWRTSITHWLVTVHKMVLSLLTTLLILNNILFLWTYDKMYKVYKNVDPV